MVIDTTLFELIRSLTEAEKKFFKMYMKNEAINKDNRYVQLFDVINNYSKKETTYNEKITKKKLGNVHWIQNLSYVKNYLFNAILESQRAYTENFTINQKIKTLLTDADFLIKKSLFQRAFELLNKAEKICEKYEKEILLLEIINIKSNIFSFLPYEIQKIKHKEFNYQREKTKKSLIKIKNLFLYRHYSYVYNYKKKTDVNYNFQNKVSPSIFTVHNNKLTIKQKPLTFKSEYILNNLLWFGCHEDGQHKLAYSSITSAVDLLEKNSHFIEEDPRIYIQILHNFLTASLIYNQVKQLNEAINKTTIEVSKWSKQLTEQYKDSILEFINRVELICLSSNGLFTQANQKLNTQKKQLRNISFYHQLNASQGFLCSAAYLYFGLGNHKTCLEYCKKVEEISPGSQFPEGIRKIRLYELLVYLEKDDYNMLVHLLRRFEYLTSNLEDCDALEKELVLFVRKYLKRGESTNNIGSLLKEFQKNILLHIEKTPELLITLQYFDILSWANSKLSGKSFMEEVQLRVKKYSPAKLLK